MKQDDFGPVKSGSLTISNYFQKRSSTIFGKNKFSIFFKNVLLQFLTYFLLKFLQICCKTFLLTYFRQFSSLNAKYNVGACILGNTLLQI